MRALPTNFGIEVETNDPHEWMEKGQLGWQVEEKPMYVDNRVVPNKKALVRTDTGDVLGVVSNQYKPVQPRAMLQTFSMAVNNFGFSMDRVGMYNNGEIIWGRADMQREFSVGSDDPTNYYMYFVTSMNGSTATTAFISTIRALCMNALHVMWPKTQISVRHVTHYTPGMFAPVLNMFDPQAWEARMQALRARELTRDALGKFVDSIYGEKPETPRGETIWKKKVQELINNLSTAPGAAQAGFTHYGLLNAYTYQVDHQSSARSLHNAAKSVTLGEGARKSVKALEVVEAL